MTGVPGFDRRGLGREPLASLRPLTVALLEAVSPSEVAAAVLASAVDVLDARAGLVSLVTQSGAELEIVLAQGFDEALMERWRRVPLASPLPLCDAVRSAEPLFFEDRAQWEARYPEMVREATHEVAAAATLPLVARGRAFGALHLSFPTARTFDEDDRTFLDTLARQCALALDRALLLRQAEEARDESRAANRRLQFLARASALFAETLEPQATLETAARLAVPDLCDWAAVDLADADGSLERLAVAHTDPAEVEWVREAQRRYPTDMNHTGHPIVRVVTTGETVFLPDLPEAVMVAAARDDDHLRLIRRLDLRSYVCAPLSARGRTLGAVTFATTRSSGRAFTPEMVALAEELARRAAVALDNARLYAQAQAEARERTEAERQAERVATDLRLITDAAPLLISYVGADLRYRFVNRGYADWFGRPAAEITGRPAEEVIGRDAFAAVRPRLLAALSGERISFDALLTYSKGEHVRHVHADYVPDRAEDGTVRGVVAVVSDITARREAEQRLEENEQRFRSLFEQNADAVYSLDLSGVFTSANAACEPFTGMNPEEIVGTSFAPMIVPEELETTTAQFREAAAGQPRSFESALRHRDGRRFDVAVTLVPIVVGGRTVGVFGITKDFTLHKETERRERFLADLSEKTRGLLDPDAVLWETARAVGDFLAASRCTYAEVANGSRDDATLTVRRDYTRGEGVRSVAGEWRLLDVGAEMVQSLREGQIVQSADTRTDPRTQSDAAQTAFAAIQARAVLSVPVIKGGELVGVLVLHQTEPRDWTREETELLVTVAERTWLALENARLVRGLQEEVAERRRAEEARRESDAALQASQANYRLVTDTIPQITWGADKDGRVDFVHPRIEAYTGVPPAEVVRAGWQCVVHPDDRSAAAERWGRALHDGGLYEAEFRVRRPDGAHSWNVASALPVRDNTGVVVRWFGTLTDVEDRRRLQGQVEEERAAALANQRRFLREMLFGLTEGRLRVCDSAADLPAPLSPTSQEVELSAATLRALRGEVAGASAGLGLPVERAEGLATAANEAAANSVRHARGGRARVHADPGSGTVQIWVRDEGEGIAEHLIHRAIEQGWTTGGFGSGFFLMMRLVDRVYLLTGLGGTTVVLEQDRTPPAPAWLDRVPVSPVA